MQGIFQKENTDKALKYGIYRHLPTYEKIIRNLVSFYITNGGVLIPQFGDVMDEPALKAIGSLFEGRKVYPIYARDIIVGGGNIHCITQQIPQ